MVTVKDFYAEWCGPCKQQEPILEQLQEKYPGINFEKIDVDENPEEAENYGVRSVPTIIVEDSGEEKERFIGLTQGEEIEKVLKN